MSRARRAKDNIRKTNPNRIAKLTAPAAAKFGTPNMARANSNSKKKRLIAVKRRVLQLRKDKTVMREQLQITIKIIDARGIITTLT